MTITGVGGILFFYESSTGVPFLDVHDVHNYISTNTIVIQCKALNASGDISFICIRLYTVCT